MAQYPLLRHRRSVPLHARAQEPVDQWTPDEASRARAPAGREHHESDRAD
jgi:hypothetical protein